MLIITLALLVFVIPSEAVSDNRCEPPGSWKPGQVLDQDRTKELGASIKRIYNRNLQKVQDCIDICCSLSADACSIAEIQITAKDTSCHLYRCFPAHKCQFKTSKEILSYERFHTESPSENITLQKAKPASTEKPTTVTANPSVETSSISLNTSTIAPVYEGSYNGKENPHSANINSLINNTSKIAGTLHQGRNETDHAHYSTDVLNNNNVQMHNANVTKPVKEDEVEDTLNNSNKTFHKSTSSVKPRKGVGLPEDKAFIDDISLKNKYSSTTDIPKINLNITQVSRQTTVPMSSSSTIALPASLLISSSTATTLQTGVSRSPSSTTTLPTTDEPVNSTAFKLPSTKSVSTATFASPTLSPTTAPSTVSELVTVKGENNSSWFVQSSSNTTSSATTTTTTTASTTVASVQHNITRYPYILPTQQEVPHETVNNSVIKEVDPVISNNTTQKPGVNDKPPDRRTMHIFSHTSVTVDFVPKTSSSINLIIGLSLGLLLVFIVIGLIGRRIFDMWQRRHYSRMDFLVDGMYH